MYLQKALPYVLPLCRGARRAGSATVPGQQNCRNSTMETTLWKQHHVETAPWKQEHVETTL